ncbi:MAG: helix-turn-helix domain-containing protein [Mycobacteriales bacterium]
MRDSIEASTDKAAAAPYDHLGEANVDRLRNLARPWSKAITADVFGSAK